MRILVIDVGDTHMKFLAIGQKEKNTSMDRFEINQDPFGFKEMK